MMKHIYPVVGPLVPFEVPATGAMPKVSMGMKDREERDVLHFFNNDLCIKSIYNDSDSYHIFVLIYFTQV